MTCHVQVAAQRGIALVISLIFLLLLTLGGIAAMSTSTLEEKMSGNLKDQHIAFQAAESALRDGESKLRQIASAASTQPPANATGSGGIWSSDSPSLNIMASAWWQTNGTEFGTPSHDIPEAVVDPKFVIEERDLDNDYLSIGKTNDNPPGIQYYRITAHGVGATQNAQGMVQATEQVRYR